VEQAQELMALLVPVSQDSRFEELELESLMRKAERTLLAQFGELTAGFNARNTVLSQKAKHAVVSHSERKLNWLRRQLSRNDLKDNIRNLYRGWSQRIEAETRSKLEEIEQKSAVKSSLQVIGLVLLLPSYHS